MAKSTIQAKSKEGDSKAYLWVILDTGGKLHAVAHGDTSVSGLLSKGGLSLALVKSRDAFMKMGATPKIVGNLINPATGKSF